MVRVEAVAVFTVVAFTEEVEVDAAATPGILNLGRLRVGALGRESLVLEPGIRVGEDSGDETFTAEAEEPVGPLLASLGRVGEDESVGAGTEMIRAGWEDGVGAGVGGGAGAAAVAETFVLTFDLRWFAVGLFVGVPELLLFGTIALNCLSILA